MNKGVTLIHRTVQRWPTAIHADFEDVLTICRLQWGYADGAGTLPRPHFRDDFVDGVVKTMQMSNGIDLWHVGNEPNNRQEWPGFGTGNEHPLTWEYVVDVYNRIWAKTDARMGPPPLDPYFGPGSDNSVWWRNILGEIDGADALYLHLKTQTNDPNEVWSDAKFGDDPLRWQYLNLKAIEPYLEMIPDRFRHTPIYVTELNPQRRPDGLGWEPGNVEWVRQAYQFFERYEQVKGIVFYRYDAAGDQSGYGLERYPEIRKAIKGVM